MYDQPWESLNAGQKHRLSLFGLRFAALDPRIWGLRPIDITESKILVPIRPFFLRASEDDSFRVREIEIDFQFKKVNPERMERYPRENDPLLEIGFGAQYTTPAAGETAATDEGYAIRLSAFPGIASGFLRRERTRYSSLSECSIGILQSGRPYHVLIQFFAHEAVLAVDGERCAALQGDFRTGLISAETSWSPVIFSRFEIKATRKLANRPEALSLTGLLSVKKSS